MLCSPRKNRIYVYAILACFVFSACVQQTESPQTQNPQSETTRTEIVITAMGDIMMPSSNQQAVAKSKYNYGILFEKIAQDMASSDLTIANLETPVDHKSPISGYPKFNARPELLRALKQVGVGMVTIANNHALDVGPNGLKRTIANIKAAGIRFSGGGTTQSEAEQPTLLYLRGITTAFLAYTYSTNAPMPRKNQNSPQVNVLKPNSASDLAKVSADVRKARQSADLVVVSLHWSDEYRTVPTPWQRRVAVTLIEDGADIILGHHPHVLQPIESYTAKNGRQGLIAFSLGNFISSQNFEITNGNRTNSKALRGDGIILNIFVQKENKKTSVSRAEFIPIWTLRDQAGKTVLYRPVNIAREIARLEAQQKRTKEEENTLKLLMFRKKVITDQLMAVTK